MSIGEGTRAKLLEAAGEEFAAKGYEAASIRKICDRVGANSAAVNYHFGSKEQLYVAAVLEAHRCGTELLPEELFREASPAEQLRRFIHHFLGNVLVISREDSWHQALILREMLQPTASASETLVREAIRPRFERLRGILRRICPEADERRLAALAFSVVGQCLHYRVAGPIPRRLVGDEVYESLDLEFLTDHITTFCLAALGQVPPLDAAGQTAADEAARA